MAYPDNKPTGNYTLRDYDFANLDQNKLPMDEYIFKNGYKNADESETDSVPDAHNQNWLFDLLHRNLRYTMGVAEENKNLLENKIATPTSIGQVKIGYGLEVSSNGTLSVVKGVAEDANIVSYDLPVGSYMLWAGNNPPEYFIEPKGQTLLRSQYPELWEFAQSNGLIGTLFGKGDGSTTFTVTDIRGNFISIANSNDKVGKFTQAGLPQHTHSGTTSSNGAHTHTRGTMNITGSVSSQNSNIEGAFTRGAYATKFSYDGSGQFYRADFNASATWTGSTSSSGAHVHNITTDNASNSIYGKSTTVTPANWGLKIILKALPTPPSNAVPTGTILNYTGASVPDGYIVPNGAEVSRTTFAKLYQWAVANNLIKDQSDIPNTPHAYYGSGDGSTTFTLPDLRGVFTRYTDLASNRGGANLGTYQDDGLPSHTHYVARDIQADSSTPTLSNSSYITYSNSGASSGHVGYALTGTTSVANIGLTSDARETSVYGKSSYVQPKNVSITPILKY